MSSFSLQLFVDVNIEHKNVLWKALLSPALSVLMRTPTICHSLFKLMVKESTTS